MRDHVVGKGFFAVGEPRPQNDAPAADARICPRGHEYRGARARNIVVQQHGEARIGHEVLLNLRWQCAEHLQDPLPQRRETLKRLKIGGEHCERGSFVSRSERRRGGGALRLLVESAGERLKVYRNVTDLLVLQRRWRRINPRDFLALAVQLRNARLEFSRHLLQHIPLRITAGPDLAGITAVKIRDATADRPVGGFANINDARKRGNGGLSGASDPE